MPIELIVKNPGDVTAKAFMAATHICHNNQGDCKSCPGSREVREYSGAIGYECNIGKYLRGQVSRGDIDEGKLAALDLHSRNTAYTGFETANVLEDIAIELLLKPKQSSV